MLSNDYIKQKSLLNYFNKKNIQAVMVEYGLTGVAVMDVCEQAQIPLIVHFHGFDAYLKSVIDEYKNKYAVMFRKASALVAVSTEMKQQLIFLGAPAHKIHYNSCGVDVHKFIQRSKQFSEPVFLFVGRFVNKKAPHLILLSFSKVLEKIPSAKLLMIGDAGLGNSNELYFRCKQMVNDMKLNHAVDFKGVLSNSQVASEMQNALVYVQHSVRPESGDSEGTPVSVLEAGASGLPVIATKHGGIKDVVLDGETGYLVNEYDVDAMAERMIELAGNPALAHKMGQAGRKRIVENFSMEKSIGNLWNIIENTIPEK